MFRLSITECIFIGIITIVCSMISHIIIANIGEEEIKYNNIFTKFGHYYWFYVLLFLFGIGIHIFISYLDMKNWSCKKQCIDDVCNIICTIPINDLTNLLLVK